MRSALLASALAGALLFSGCSGTPPAPVAAPQIAAALDTIAAHGLPEWAAWGRAHSGSIGVNEALVPAGQLGWTWQFVGAGGTQYAVALGDRWLALGSDDRGLVLLHELFHARTGDMGHPQALADLLRDYRDGGR